MASDVDDVQPAYMAVLEVEVSLLSILIQGPKHPGIDIYVFLEPLMQRWKLYGRRVSIS